MDDVEFAREFGGLVEKVNRIADRLDADQSIFVPREVCNLTHTATVTDRILMGQRMTAVESDITELRQARDRDGTEDKRAGQARILALIAVIGVVGSEVIKAIWG